MPRIRKTTATNALSRLRTASIALQKQLDQLPREFDPDQISSQVEAFEKAVTGVHKALKLEERRPKDSKPLPEETPSEGAAKPSGAADRAKVATFLEGMANSMVSIQRRLDAHNTEYLTTALSDPAVVPAQFRMPRLSAELHFALEKVTSEGWDILIYEKANEARELHQQTLTAEMVAAPPPPELLESLRAVTPLVSLVLAPNERNQIRLLVEQGQPRVQKELLETWARVLIFRAQTTTSGGEYLLALSRGTDNDGDLGIWHVKEKPPSVTVARRYGVKPRASEHTAELRKLLSAVADSQVAWLKRLGSLE